MPSDDSKLVKRMYRSQLSGWSIPLAYAVAAIILGLTLPRAEAKFIPGWTSGMSSAAAMALFSSIATGMITLTGIVFSLVFLMVQFSATAYSPRLVLWMARDPFLSHALGIFTATFLYAVAALAWVDRHGSGKVPFLSGLLVIALLLASVMVFIRLVQRIERLQIHNVLAFTGDFARHVIERMYPPLESSLHPPHAGDLTNGHANQILIYSGPPRTVQSLDIPMLVALAQQAGGIIEMLTAVGDTLVESTPLLSVRPASAQIEEKRFHLAIRTGAGRTFEQDPKYSIHLLVDIAIRALSPAINDPTTAVQALDQIEDLLLRLGRRHLESGEVRDSAGNLRVVVRVPTWEDFLDLAFSQIRYYGATSLQVMRRMKALLHDLMDALPEERRPALRHHAERLAAAIARSFPDLEDQIEASAEDREGVGAPRRGHVESRPEPTQGAN